MLQDFKEFLLSPKLRELDCFTYLFSNNTNFGGVLGRIKSLNYLNITIVLDLRSYLNYFID